jgi:hypothetical protein
MKLCHELLNVYFADLIKKNIYDKLKNIYYYYYYYYYY